VVWQLISRRLGSEPPVAKHEGVKSMESHAVIELLGLIGQLVQWLL
jgi:hypothetical protein